MHDLRCVNIEPIQLGLDMELEGETARLSCNNEDYFVIDRVAFNQGINAQFDIDIRAGEQSQRLLQEGHMLLPYLWRKVGSLCATDYKWV